MPTTCVVGGCHKTSDDRGISFFCFPNGSHDAKRLEQWIAFVKRTRKDFLGPGVSHSQRARVCSLHFSQTDWDQKYLFKKKLLKTCKVKPTLNKTAVPSLQPKKGPDSPTQKRRHFTMMGDRIKGSKVNGFATSVHNDRGEDSGHGQICCLMDDGVRCKRPAGNACYSKRIAKTVQQRKLKLNIDHSVQHIYICNFHKGKIHIVRSNRRKRKTSDIDGAASPIHDGDVSEVDLYALQVNTLRRYKKHFKIQTKPGLNKAQLAEIVAKHFKTLPVKEKDALTYFIYMVKNNKSRFDLKNNDV